MASQTLFRQGRSLCHKPLESARCAPDVATFSRAWAPPQRHPLEHPSCSCSASPTHSKSSTPPSLRRGQQQQQQQQRKHGQHAASVAVRAASRDLEDEGIDVDEFEVADLEGIPASYDSPAEELLSHRSFQVTTAEDWTDCVGEDALGEGDEDEVWETSNTRWFFETTAESRGKTWHQYILQEQGQDPKSYQLGKRLAMWDGREDFVSLNRVVHLRDQFPYLTLAYDRETESAAPLQEALPSNLDPEALLNDIQALSTNLTFQAAYPVKWFGSSKGSDLLPCMFDLPPGGKLNPRTMWALLGIAYPLAQQFPEPIAFSTNAAFSKYMRKQIGEWRDGWEEWLERKYAEGEVSEDMFEYLQGGPQFAELDERAQEFAQYVDPPILQLVVGNKALNMDPVPFFWLGRSPSDPERVLGMMGAIWHDDDDLPLDDIDLSSLAAP